jgi:hypothetical protein
MKKKIQKSWTVNITFVPFETDEARDEAYRKWARIFLEGKKGEMLAKKGTNTILSQKKTKNDNQR